MSIRTKLALTLFLAVGLFLGLDLTLRRQSSTKSFELLERSRCAAQVDGVRRGLEFAYDELAALARNAQIQANEAPGILLHQDGRPLTPDEQGAVLSRMDDADLGLAVRHDGTVVDYRLVTADGNNGVLREVPDERLSESHPFMKTWATGSSPRGLYETRAGLLMVGSYEGHLGSDPVLHLRGRWLSGEGLARVQGSSGSTFVCDSLRQHRMLHPAAVLPAPGEIQIDSIGNDRLLATTVIKGLGGTPAAVVSTPVLRNELVAIEGMRRQDVLTAIAVAILFPLILLILIQAVITGPLGRLTRHAQIIGDSDDAAQRLNLNRKDEIGVLAAEFDRMLDELERSRRAQQRVARMSGRSDVATGVMHGVGNLVNSAGVAASLASVSVDKVSMSDLRAILDALKEREGDLDDYLKNDPQGQHLLAFFEGALDSVENQVDSVQREVASIVGSVDEVTSLVASLGSEETREVVLERISLAEEVEAAIMRSGLQDPTLSILCRPNLNHNLEARLDRQRFEEILDVLLINARESVEGVPTANRQITLQLTSIEASRFRISVEDSGQGIDQGDLESIFGLNVTTKGDGRGRGLHMACIAAKELGGDLHAWSGGVGEGAILTLELPLTQEAGTAA